MNKARVSGIALQYVPSQVSSFPQLTEESKTLFNFFFLPESSHHLSSATSVFARSTSDLLKLSTIAKKVTDQTDG